MVATDGHELLKGRMLGLMRVFRRGDGYYLRLPADTALPGFSTRVRKMTTAEARLALAQMALRFDNIDGAEHWFESVLSDTELRALAESGLGRIAGYRGDVEAANARFDLGLAIDHDLQVGLAHDPVGVDRVVVDLGHLLEQRLAPAAGGIVPGQEQHADTVARMQTIMNETGR